jgi:hypothetical protein
MLPRSPEGTATRFHLSAQPAADADGCSRGGAETWVEVLVPASIPTAVDRVVTVEGRLQLYDRERWSGYIYRLSEARIVEAAP